MGEPKLVLFDLETLPNMKEVMKIFPNISAYPGLSLKASINSIICFGYKIYGDSKVHCVNAWDFKNWDKDINDDSKVVEAAYEILKDADGIITHNGRRFDWKFLQTRLLYHKMAPLPNIRHIDTCTESKRNLFTFNNRLNTVAQFLTDQEKMENGGWNLWIKVSERDPKSMKLMTEYCRQDVLVLEEVFKRLRPLIKNIPNYNMFSEGEKRICPSCGSSRIKKHGMRYTNVSAYQRYICKDCWSTCATNMQDKAPRL